MWKGKEVMVTGGAGVIGIQVVKKLTERGAIVKCIDVSPKPKQIPEEVDYHRKDLSEISLRELSDLNPNAIFHLAATFERTEESPGFWNKNYRNNVLSTHKIVDFSKSSKNLEKFIFASSYLVYSPELYLFAAPRNIPRKLKEADLINPRNLCGAAKYYAEKELEFSSKTASNLAYVSARIFRVYGCGSRDIISRWIRLALNEEELVVYQKENMFDYIYAEDVAEALIRMAEKVNNSEKINVGMGVSRRISDVLDIIGKMIPDTRIREVSVRGLFESSCANISKLIKLTGWRPETRVDEGIRRVIKYEEEAKRTYNT